MKKQTTKNKERNIVRVIDSFFTVKTEGMMQLRKIILLISTIIYVVGSYFLAPYLFDKTNQNENINLLINIDLALFALQIATFTLILSPFNDLQKKLQKKKMVYIKEIEKDIACYDSEVFESLNAIIEKNNNIFRFNIFSLFVLSIHFILCMIIGCTNFAPVGWKLAFLFSDLINQLVAFIQYLWLLVSLFYHSKKSLYADFALEKNYLLVDLKVDVTEKTNHERADMAKKIEMLSRKEELSD